MIDWISADTPPVEKLGSSYEYLVTVEYCGEGNVNGRRTFAMTCELMGREKVPTWCWQGVKSVWKVLFWAEFPEPCQDS